MAGLTVAALGIVYGDIGTSPLYTMKTIFSSEYKLDLTPDNLLGVISLILWGLTIIVTLKYVTLILRADNQGEGGIMALLSLALSSITRTSRWYVPLTMIGLFGAALFFGDGVITPAISVLSAMEGLDIATPAFHPYVVPITVGVLMLLYMAQRFGTAGIGRWFGPIMFLWFGALAAMGLINVLRYPGVLAALNPFYAVSFLWAHGWIGFIALGAIVLAFTGAEALYADLGHFGGKPIRIAWYFVVFPSLALNYLGQGAILLLDPKAVENPFFHQLGPWSVLPLVVISTVATVIASQATISGTYSMTREAIALGFMPRMLVVHTSEREYGQIYVPIVNWLQFFAVIAAVIGFGSSDNLASAYGIAVTATMVTTTILTFFVIRYGWKLNPWICWGATLFFVTIDGGFFASNALKIVSGGWFPLVLGLIAFVIMLTWKQGRHLMSEVLQSHAIPLEDFLNNLFIEPPTRVPGTAVFLRSESDGVPHALLHNLTHNKVIHEQIIFLTVYNLDVPTIPDDTRLEILPMGNQCFQVNVRYGFKETRDIPKVLDLCRCQGVECESLSTSYFISRQTIVPTFGKGMAMWRERLFAAMSRNARGAADYYHIPANRVIELGTQVEI
ncbi:MAG: potassium transporter Kup [Burkholderiaceae bacterium]|nr:potassium transporter Kup [Burkholderiaceae bacterium]